MLNFIGVLILYDTREILFIRNKRRSVGHNLPNATLICMKLFLVESRHHHFGSWAPDLGHKFRGRNGNAVFLRLTLQGLVCTYLSVDSQELDLELEESCLRF